ncbi:hypothetical protein BGX24_008264 [Mortierella sp. AD032]|nr:hypothetical protein BGX24_008264 [Mortierella sp. AD032]
MVRLSSLISTAIWIMQWINQAAAAGVRTVAVGDLHSDLNNTLTVLKLAQLVDDNTDWIGSDDTLVQIGGLVDKGPDTIAIIELFQKLAIQAGVTGGAVINILGEHEVYNLAGHYQYVSKEDLYSFKSKRIRVEAWKIRTGWIGRFVFKTFKAAYVHNKHTFFSNGDVNAFYAKLGAEGISNHAREALFRNRFTSTLFGKNGPVASRAYGAGSSSPENICKKVKEVKTILGVKRLVAGHIQQNGQILSLCNGTYLQIDVGISSSFVHN